MMLMWVSEVFWDPEQDRQGRDVPAERPIRPSVRREEDALSPAAPLEIPQSAESW